jgi:hypothetical protein
VYDIAGGLEVCVTFISNGKMRYIIFLKEEGLDFNDPLEISLEMPHM